MIIIQFKKQEVKYKRDHWQSQYNGAQISWKKVRFTSITMNFFFCFYKWQVRRCWYNMKNSWKSIGNQINSKIGNWLIRSFEFLWISNLKSFDCWYILKRLHKVAVHYFSHHLIHLHGFLFAVFCLVIIIIDNNQ